MAVLNYSTTIEAGKTVQEMQEALARAGAARISVDYDDGLPVALAFMLVTPHGLRHFHLPVNIDAMHRLLMAEDDAGRIKTGGMSRDKRRSREQAARVAWRVMKDWLLAQLTLVATELVSLDHAMLAYLVVDGREQTLYESYKEREARGTLRALEGRAP